MSDLPTDTRQPIGYANYPGHHLGILKEGAKGPNYMGELMYPVVAIYDGDRTRVGFSLIPPADETATV